MLSNICMLCSQTISLLLLCFQDAFVHADAVLKGMHRPKTDNLESIAGAQETSCRLLQMTVANRLVLKLPTAGVFPDKIYSA
jgi:hypothetical protein